MSDYFSMLCVNLKYVMGPSYFDGLIFAYGILEWPHTKSKEKLVNPWWRSRQLLLLLPLRGVDPGGAGVSMAHPDQLTLFQPGGTDYAHQITTAPSPQIFEASAASESTS